MHKLQRDHRFLRHVIHCYEIELESSRHANDVSFAASWAEIVVQSAKCVSPLPAAKRGVLAQSGLCFLVSAFLSLR